MDHNAKSSHIFTVQLHSTLWPIAQNQIYCDGPKGLTKWAAVAHKTNPNVQQCSGPQCITKFGAVSHSSNRPKKSNFLQIWINSQNCFWSRIKGPAGYFWYNHFRPNNPTLLSLQRDILMRFLTSVFFLHELNRHSSLIHSDTCTHTANTSTIIRNSLFHHPPRKSILIPINNNHLASQ